MKDDKYSTYVDGELSADVIKVDSHWGCRFWRNNEAVKTELYKGHSEAYAEDAAENYVIGVKTL